jgi:putative peptidoglycan lipid II flippase
MAFSIGMLMFSVHYLVLRGFYALEDTRTPFFIQCLVAAVNIVCAIGLTMAVDPRYVAPALALAYGASYTVGAAVSFTVLSRRLRSTSSRTLATFVLRVVVAGAAAGAVTWLCLQGLEAAGLDDSHKPDSLALLGLGGLTGMVCYLGMARLLGVSEIARILGLMQTRGKRG